MRAISFCDCTRLRSGRPRRHVCDETGRRTKMRWNRKASLFGSDIGMTMRVAILPGSVGAPSCSMALTRDCRMVSTSTGWSMSRLAHQSRRLCTLLMALAIACMVLVHPLHAQDDPLNQIHVTPPPPKPAPPSGPPPKEGKDALHARPGERIRVDVNLVLVPLIVTDPLNRLVTGLEKNEFFLFENNAPQEIKSFSAEDAPVSIGIIMDLSGSMTNKVVRARESIIEFLRTSNPQDEFFIIGFNDRPELIEDFTSSVDDIEARLQTVRAGRRTALLDAIYYGVNKMKQARY